MQLFWFAVGAIACMVIANLFIVSMFRARRAEQRFNEFLACHLLYELGDGERSSMPLGVLRMILPCHPEEADELLEHLHSEQQIEIVTENGARLAHLTPRPYLRHSSGNWRRYLPPDHLEDFERAMQMSRGKFLARVAPVAA